MHNNEIEQLMDVGRRDSQTTDPTWTDAEHDEIMRLHIIAGLTISEAKRRVFEKRLAKCKAGELSGTGP